MLLLLWQVCTKYPRCPTVSQLQMQSLPAPARCSLSELKWLHEPLSLQTSFTSIESPWWCPLGLSTFTLLFSVGPRIFSSLCGHELSKLQGRVKNRGAWRGAVHGVAKSQTRLSDWPTAKQRNMRFWKWMVTLTLSLVSTERQKCLFISWLDNIFLYLFSLNLSLAANALLK